MEHKPGEIQGVRVFCNGDMAIHHGLLEEVTLAEGNAVFSAPISPVSQRIQLPLRVHLESPLQGAFLHPQRARFDNQFITYLMIDVHSGFAPALYQAGVGTAVVARQDGKPLSACHLEAVWMFCDMLLDMFAAGDEVVPERDMTRAKFEEFFKNYKEGRAEMANIVSPYDV